MENEAGSPNPMARASPRLFPGRRDTDEVGLGGGVSAGDVMGVGTVASEIVGSGVVEEVSGGAASLVANGEGSEPPHAAINISKRRRTLE